MNLCPWDNKSFVSGQGWTPLLTKSILFVYSLQSSSVIDRRWWSESRSCWPVRKKLSRQGTFYLKHQVIISLHVLHLLMNRRGTLPLSLSKRWWRTLSGSWGRLREATRQRSKPLRRDLSQRSLEFPDSMSLYLILICANILSMTTSDPPQHAGDHTSEGCGADEDVHRREERHGGEAEEGEGQSEGRPRGCCC